MNNGLEMIMMYKVRTNDRPHKNKHNMKHDSIELSLNSLSRS